jgi:hypothetical protein
MTVCRCLILGLFVTAVAGAAELCPYSNELEGFRFCENAAWRSLHPLVSTAAHVRRVLGQPIREDDIAHWGEPYPGDAKAEAPVLTYDSPKWEILIYFVRSNSGMRDEFPADLRDRLLSIDLIPKLRMSFKNVGFPAVYRKRHVIAADAAWDEYSDGSGLVYSVYTSKPDQGDERPGDLYRISYGLSDRARADHGRGPEEHR